MADIDTKDDSDSVKRTECRTYQINNRIVIICDVFNKVIDGLKVNCILDEICIEELQSQKDYDEYRKDFCNYPNSIMNSFFCLCKRKDRDNHK